MNVAKFEHYLGNKNDYENDVVQPKRGTPRMLIITVVFEDKSMLTLEDEKGTFPQCL